MKTLINNNLKKRSKNNENFYKSNLYDGTVVIVDISGFTRFVRSTDINVGKEITRRLLSTVTQSNFLDFKISEIEGDAILFYKFGRRFSTKEILSQYEVMLFNFNKELSFLNQEFEKQIELSLKMVAHFGTLAEYAIGRFKKLYGEPVIEAHRLLKNSLPTNAYVLMTEDFLGSDPFQNENHNSFKGKMTCEIYGDLRRFCFTYIDYT